MTEDKGDLIEANKNSFAILETEIKRNPRIAGLIKVAISELSQGKINEIKRGVHLTAWYTFRYERESNADDDLAFRQAYTVCIFNHLRDDREFRQQCIDVYEGRLG